jgi:hypothetical protein
MPFPLTYDEFTEATLPSVQSYRGRIIFRTDLQAYYVSNGAAWSPLAAELSGGEAEMLASGAVIGETFKRTDLDPPVVYQCFGTDSSVASNWGPAGAVVTDSNGSPVIVLNDGTQYPMTYMAGNPVEPLIAGVVNQLVLIDSGNDANDHAEILWTFNATMAGDLLSVDHNLASQRLLDSNADANAEVVKTGISGASNGAVWTYLAPTGLMHLHIAVRGEDSAFTVAAGNTATGSEMVYLTFDEMVTVVELRVGTSYVGGGAGLRYRQITVTGYAVAE